MSTARLAAVLLLGPLACGPAEKPDRPPAVPRPAPPRAAEPAGPGQVPPAGPAAGTAAATLPKAAAPQPERSPCPRDMVFVDTVHCPDTREHKVKLTCLRSTRNVDNNLKICHEFAPGQQCPSPLRRQRYCIDRYEYPNKKGAHPPVLISAYDAAALCAEQGKRMCWQSEWTAACEGPDKLPFPYGYERSGKQCNIDNPWIKPYLDKVHDQHKEIQDKELRRIDQSIPSGSRETCRSGYGVYDLTGNFDEWVLTEYRRGKGKWAGLKGGAWGHVRNACRPITTSHVAHFTYYFISTRCCQDPDPKALEPVAGGPPLWTPPPAPTPPPPGGKPVSRGWTPR